MSMRLLGAVAAVILFAGVGILTLQPATPEGAPFRFVVTVALVFAIATLAAAIAVAAVGPKGRH